MSTRSSITQQAKDPRDRLLTNIFSNWLSTLVTAAIAFFVSPFLVHTLGKEQYGIWALVLSVVAYTNFFDFGMKQSLSRYIPKHYGKGDWDGLNEVLNSSNLMYALAGTMVFLVSVIIGLFFVDVFDIPPELLSVTTVVFIVVGANQASIFFFMTPSALGPFHRWDLSNMMSIVKDILTAAIIVLLLKMGYRLLALAVTTLAVSLGTNIIRVLIRNRLFPMVKYGIAYIKKHRVRELIGYSWISFLIVVSTLIIFNTDNVIIGIYISATAVTFYSIAGTIINYLRVISGSIGVSLTPVVSHMESTEGSMKIHALYSALVTKLFYLFAALCVSILLLGGKFIYLWMGPEFGDTIKVLHILIIPACLYLPQIAANSVLLGIGQHKPLFYLTASEALSNITLSLILVHWWGMFGVAAGTAIPQVIIYSAIYPVVFHRIVGASVKTFYRRALRMVLLGVLFSLPPALATRIYNHVDGWPGFIIDVIFVGAFILAGFWWMVFDADNRTAVKNKLNKVFHK